MHVGRKYINTFLTIESSNRGEALGPDPDCETAGKADSPILVH